MKSSDLAFVTFVLPIPQTVLRKNYNPTTAEKFNFAFSAGVKNNNLYSNLFIPLRENIFNNNERGKNNTKELTMFTTSPSMTAMYWESKTTMTPMFVCGVNEELITIPAKVVICVNQLNLAHDSDEDLLHMFGRCEVHADLFSYKSFHKRYLSETDKMSRFFSEEQLLW